MYHRFGTALPTIWCAWFALLAGAPYMPKSSSPDAIAGASSLSSLSAWVFLGVLIGLWVSRHPDVRRQVGRHGALVTLAFIVGVVASVAFCALVWIHVVSLAPAIRDASHQGIPARIAAYSSALFVETGSLLKGAPIICFVCSLLCGFLFPWVVETDDLPDFETRRSPIPSLLLPIVALVVGALQPVAWARLLPHSPFPQPLIYVGSPSGGDPSLHDWQSVSPLAILPSAIMLILALLLVRACEDHRSRANACDTFMSFCIGGLLFRAVSRIAPSIYGVTEAVSYLCLGVYIVALLILLFAISHMNRRVSSHLEDETAASRERETALLESALTKSGWSHIKGLGLTRKESLVLCASLLHYPSAKTASIIGVKSSTVREYRRRVSVKMGVASIEEAVELLPTSSVTPRFSEERSDHAPQETQSRAQAVITSVALSGVLCLAVLVFLPFGGGVRPWTDSWTSCMGMGIGLILTAAARSTPTAPYGSRRLVRKHSAANVMIHLAAAAAVLVLVAAILSQIVMRTGLLPLSPGHAPQKALNVASLVAISFWSAIALSRLRELARAALGTRPLLSALPMASVCFAVVITGVGGSQPWALAVVLSALTAIPCSAVLLHRVGPTVFLARAEDHTPRIPSLLCVAIAAWTWGEIWRSQDFTSMMPVLEWGSASILGIALLCSAASLRMFKTAALSTCMASLVTAFFLGSGAGLIIVWAHIFLFGKTTEIVGAHIAQSPIEVEPMGPWYSPLFAAGCALVGGPLITNAYGFAVLHPGKFQFLGSAAATETFAYLAVAIAMASVIVFFVAGSPACRRILRLKANSQVLDNVTPSKKKE